LTPNDISGAAEAKMMMCCGWGVKAGWLIPFVDWISMWVAGKTV